MANYTELDVGDIAQWSLSAQCVVLVVLFAVLQVVGYWWYLDGRQSELSQLRQQEQILKQTVHIKTNKAAALPQLQTQLDKIRQRYEHLSLQFPVQNELAIMLAAVNEKGLQNNLTFTRMDWGAKESQGFLYRLPLNIELTGDYDDIGRFSQAISALPRVINFMDVEWRRARLESSMLHFQVRAYTYQFKPEAEDDD